MDKKLTAKEAYGLSALLRVQNDKYLEAMEYEIPLPTAPDYQRVQENIEKIEMWQKEFESCS